MRNKLLQLTCLALTFMVTLVMPPAHNAFAFIPTPVTKPSPNVSGILVAEVKKGDTLSGLLHNAAIEKKQIVAAIEELRNIYSPSKLALGQKVRVSFSINDENDQMNLALLQIMLPKNKEIQVKQFSNGSFMATQLDTERDVRLVKASGQIQSNLFTAAQKAAIPAAVVLDLIKNYSYDVDFQRDLRKGNSFEVLFEQYYDQDGEVSGTGKVVYATLALNKETLSIYHFTTPDGRSAYYDENGRSIKKSLLRTPIDGARITSGFGRRHHPILGYNKMHKGLDFGAPRGTPIYAAGDGTISYLGRKGGYGKYIKIYHGNGHETAYAHLKSYAKRLKRGRKVEQGQVIGYVGTTGRSTGPHLHYEVLLHGRHVNPLSIKTTSSQQLRGLQFGIFNQYKRQIASIFGEERTQLANAN